MSSATLHAPVSTSADEGQILAVVQNLRQAQLDKDVALFAAQFAPNAAIYNLAPPLVHHGIDSQEKQDWFDSWATPIEIDSRDLNVIVSGDFAVCHGFLHMSGTKRGADRPVNFWMRETLCLRRQGSVWQIVH